MVRIFKKKISKLYKNDFIKSAFTLVTGTGISQIIPLIISPIIARLYVPADYAVLAAYTSVTILLTIVATGMYDAALMLDKNDRDAVNTAAAAVTITIATTLIACLLMLLFKNRIAKFTGNEDVSFWLYLVPVTVFCSGIYQTLNVWNNRKARYKRLASNRVIMTTITSSVTLALGLLHFHEKGLLISLIIGQIGALLILSLQTFYNDRVLLGQISRFEINQSFKRHKDFPKYNMPQGFLDGIKESSTVWIISVFYGANALGSFSFAKSILMRPLQIIGNSVSQVFYQKASSIYNSTGDIYNFSKRTFITLFAIGFPFTITIIFFGKEIFDFVFSAQWVDAGILSQILILWLLFSFVGSAISTIPLILRKQKQFFFWAIAFNCLPVIVLFILSRMDFNIFFSITSFTLTSVVIYILVFNWMRTLLKKNRHIV